MSLKTVSFTWHLMLHVKILYNNYKNTKYFKFKLQVLITLFQQ